MYESRKSSFQTKGIYMLHGVEAVLLKPVQTINKTILPLTHAVATVVGTIVFSVDRTRSRG